MTLLTQEQIEAKLEDLEVEWAVIDRVHLERVYQCTDFNEAITFVNKVAELANTQNHHPDIFIHDYNSVTIRTTTHDVNGLTNKDFDLATAIDQE